MSTNSGICRGGMDCNQNQNANENEAWGRPGIESPLNIGNVGGNNIPNVSPRYEDKDYFAFRKAFMGKGSRFRDSNSRYGRQLPPTVILKEKILVPRPNESRWSGARGDGEWDSKSKLKSASKSKPKRHAKRPQFETKGDSKKSKILTAKASGAVLCNGDDAAFGSNASFPDDAAFGSNAAFSDDAAFGSNAAFSDDAAFGSNAAFSDDAVFGSNAAFSDDSAFSIDFSESVSGWFRRPQEDPVSFPTEMTECMAGVTCDPRFAYREPYFTESQQIPVFSSGYAAAMSPSAQHLIDFDGYLGSLGESEWRGFMRNLISQVTELVSAHFGGAIRDYEGLSRFDREVVDFFDYSYSRHYWQGLANHFHFRSDFGNGKAFRSG